MKNRKIPAFLLLLILCFILSGCGKSKAVKSVESLISEVGDVTLDSEESIQAAEDAYNALSGEEKEQVENSAELESKKRNLLL